MKVSSGLIIGLLIFPGSLLADSKSDLTVMTQNQYLGTALLPLISATDATSRNTALINAIVSIRASRTPERIASLAGSIADRKPHFVGLQEVVKISCSPVSACSLLETAGVVFNDHLELTEAALDMVGADYRVVASVDNLSIDEIPVDLDADGGPDVFISITDRDVILVRGDIDDAEPADFGCSGASGTGGCNYSARLTEVVLDGQPSVLEIPVIRGFVGVDATVRGNEYRIVTTHMEIPFISNGTEPYGPVQALQADELLTALSSTPNSTRTIVVGDFNSSPEDLYTDNPYDQMIEDGFTDTWTRRPGKPNGFTCCQASDLSNLESLHHTRIDLVFAKPVPRRVKANVSSNQTATGLWASDHSTVSVRLQY